MNRHRQPTIRVRRAITQAFIFKCRAYSIYLQQFIELATPVYLQHLIAFATTDFSSTIL